MESDGAAAVIVTSPDRAPDLRQPPVRIRAVAMSGEYKWGTASFNTNGEDFVSTGQRRAGETSTASGLGPGDVDVALFYDAFTPSVILGLEDWAFCGIGEGGPFVADGNITPGAASPSTRTVATWPRCTSRALPTFWRRSASCGARRATRWPVPRSRSTDRVGASPGGGVLLRRW